MRDLPEIDGYESDQMIVDGYVASPQSLYHEEESDEDMDSASEASEIDDTPDRPRHRFHVRRENIHEQQR